MFGSKRALRNEALFNIYRWLVQEFAGEFGADEFPSLEEAQAMAGCMGNTTASSNTKQGQ